MVSVPGAALIKSKNDAAEDFEHMTMLKILAPPWTIFAFVLSAQAQTVHSANINNAPAWQPNHGYTSQQEVETAGGVGIAGTRGYKLLNASCKSGNSGGPSGTGSSITDGTCTWKYLSDIDYTSISRWLKNGLPAETSAPNWAPSTTYNLYDVVTNGVNAYAAVTAGTSCSSGSGPTGGYPTINQNDCGGVGGVNWTWVANTNMSSMNPHNAITQLRGRYIGYVYNGGEYLNDGRTAGSSSTISIGPGTAGYGHNTASCGGECFPLDYYLPTMQTSMIELTAAPGESFQDAANPTATYNPAQGVAIRCDGGDMTNSSACIVISDWNVFISRIQLKTTKNAVDFYTHGALSDMLFDSDLDGLFLDDNITLANSVVYAGNIGVINKYHNTYINDTILGKTGAVIGIAQVYHPSYSGSPTLNDTVIMGFAYCAAYSPSNLGSDMPGFEQASPAADYNATDVGSGGAQSGTPGISPASYDPNASGKPYTSMPCPGSHTLYNQPFTTATFLDTTSGSYDARLASGSSLLNAGAATPGVSQTVLISSLSSGYWPDDAVVYQTQWAGPGTGTCTPTQSPYGPSSKINQMCGNPTEGVSGRGISAGTTLVALNGNIYTASQHPIFIALSAACPSCTNNETISFSWAPVQANDIFGAARSLGYSIGAIQSQSRPGGSTMGAGRRSLLR